MAVLTVNQIIDNIDSFINNIKKLSKSYYMFVGRPNPWNEDAAPPAANASVEQTELSVYRDIVYGKLISNNDVSYMIRNIPWTNNTIYSQYSQYDGNLINKDFYVITDTGEVYKCIYNNANAASTVKPSLNTPSGQFQTSDGYIWKYMYSIDPAANTKFSTNSYVPIVADANVELNAIPGTIDYITLTNPGTGYEVYEEGFVAGVANNGYEIILPNNAVQIEDYYTGSTIYLRAGGGAGQIRDITKYYATDRRIRANTPFTVYVNLNLENVQGSINIGDTVTQNSVDISYFYAQGYFYDGNNVIQSDTGAQGRIVIANSSHLIVSKNNSSNAFAANYPFYNTSSDGVLKSGNVTIASGNNLIAAIPEQRSGNVTITAGSNLITANTGTNFSTDYAVGDFIRVGPDPMVNSSLWTLKSGNVTITAGSNLITANTGTDFVTEYAVGNFIKIGNNISNSQIRLITAVNSTVIAVNGNFSQTYVSNVHYLVANDQISKITAVNSTAISVNSAFSQTYVSNVHFWLPRLTTDYSSGQYIRVGNTSSNIQIRRITSVNTTFIVVDANTPFAQTYTSNVHYLLPVAAVPTSLTIINRYGSIGYTNINGININIANTTPVGKTFIAGEKVVQVDVNNVNQGANAIVSFSNNSVVQLSDVNGTLTAGLYVLGQSSNVKALITATTSFPNITLQQPNGEFAIGQTIYVSNSSGDIVANATVISISTVPNQLTEYVISPKVAISGDGNGALAYAYVDISGNNSSRQITEVRLINQGRNYTTANVVITSNNQYGANATASLGISPTNGHGSNAYIELASKYAGISVEFANGDNESYKFPVIGEFRRIGIIEDPTFNDATLTLDTFDRVKLYLGDTNGTSFTPGEIALQYYTGKAGVVVYSNSSYLELKNVLDTDNGLPFYTYATNDSNTTIVGLTSNAHANVLTSNNGANSRVSYFTISSAVESASEVTSGATATIQQIISNTSIRVSNIRGHFNANDILYDTLSNAYANVVSIAIANGNQDATTNFGHAFNQTCRITLNSNTGAFQQFEKVTQEVTNGVGTVLSFNTDQDLVVTASNGTFNTGDIITSNTTSATAIVLYANSSYVRCTAVDGIFGNNDVITNQLSIGGTISAVYPALVLYNVYNIFASGTNVISGANSGATGVALQSNTIIYPELVRESGSTTYIENIVPFERSNGSIEKINIVIKF